MPHTNSKNRIRNSKRSSTSKSSSISKRSRRPQVALYDENDRYDYLTGFSSRKKAAKVAAQERAAEKARAEKLEFRRQLKEARLSKIKETIEQQAQWYGVDAFADFEEHCQDSQTPRRVERVIENSSNEENNKQMDTTTMVTIEPLEVDHTVLMNLARKHLKPENRHSHRDQNTNQSTTSLKLRNNKNINDRSRSTNDKNKKSNKKKKIPYESRATKSIEKAKKQFKRDSKSKKR